MPKAKSTQVAERLVRVKLSKKWWIERLTIQATIDMRSEAYHRNGQQFFFSFLVYYFFRFFPFWLFHPPKSATYWSVARATRPLRYPIATLLRVPTKNALPMTKQTFEELDAELDADTLDSLSAGSKVSLEKGCCLSKTSSKDLAQRHHGFRYTCDDRVLATCTCIAVNLLTK